ncbi:Uncharacterized protein BP5553_01835 [Venustampulla echinocandica]|uniref:ERCC1-like central domain-containing protein n=1 Tax=Venustampulla echinocandica TaxID=2656787 RepID=A0A370U254_9HELO|nr:Uncharacterized protein BP5553_01835 [Venustampulla echinocandica]RDL41856.1 Uncharacterized protein BP5553_01835 [Venustampulla echinocandica]
MDDDEFDTDADLLAALAASEAALAAPTRVQQPTPQRLDHAPPVSSVPSHPKVVQPTPQALPSRATGSGSSILVSPRQKGNPILTNLRSFAWEYSDIPADYVLGQTTCALFLSLKYHRLHPEYIYNRIRNLQGKYNLRILLTMVDIGNHEDSLKELAKTSLVNNVTVILSWSAAEAARYLELYKSYEHANPTAIRGVESKGYAEKMVEFVTVPRSINKTDAVTLVSAFGSLRAAVNARPEEIAVIGGWGEKKVRKWCTVVNEPFRVRKAARRGLSRNGGTEDVEARRGVLERAIPLSTVPRRQMQSTGEDEISQEPGVPSNGPDTSEPDEDELEALAAAAAEAENTLRKESRNERTRKDEELSGGLAAALAKLRDNS